VFIKEFLEDKDVVWVARYKKEQVLAKQNQSDKMDGRSGDHEEDEGSCPVAEESWAGRRTVAESEEREREWWNAQRQKARQGLGEERSKSRLISKLLGVAQEALDEAREQGKNSQEEKALRDRMNILKFMRLGVLFHGCGKRGIDQDWKDGGGSLKKHEESLEKGRGEEELPEEERNASLIFPLGGFLTTGF